MLSPTREQLACSWVMLAPFFSPMLAGVLSGLAGREVLGASVTAAGVSGFLWWRASALVLKLIATPLRLMPPHPAMAFAFGHVLSDDALWPRAVGLKLGASALGHQQSTRRIGLAVTSQRRLFGEGSQLECTYDGRGTGEIHRSSCGPVTFRKNPNMRVRG